MDVENGGGVGVGEEKEEKWQEKQPWNWSVKAINGTNCKSTWFSALPARSIINVFFLLLYCVNVMCSFLLLFPWNYYCFHLQLTRSV